MKLLITRIGNGKLMLILASTVIFGSWLHMTYRCIFQPQYTESHVSIHGSGKTLLGLVSIFNLVSGPTVIMKLLFYPISKFKKSYFKQLCVV
jgi:hypothetical protein